jgi:hypothetical protein
LGTLTQPVGKGERPADSPKCNYYEALLCWSDAEQIETELSNVHAGLFIRPAENHEQ